MMMQCPQEWRMGSHALPTLAYCTGSDVINVRGEGGAHMLELHVHCYHQLSTQAQRVYSDPQRRWWTVAWSLHDSEPPMSSRLHVSHSITSTSASLQGPRRSRGHNKFPGTRKKRGWGKKPAWNMKVLTNKEKKQTNKKGCKLIFFD